MSQIRLVCFDWGGVVLRISRSWEDRFVRAGFAPPPELDEPAFASQLDQIADDYQRGLLTCEQYFSTIAAKTDGAYSPAHIQQVHDAWLIDEYDGVGLLIDKLNKMDTVTTGMLSNTNAAHWARQHDGPGGFPAASRIARRLASHELGYAKPDPAIFRVATDAFGVTPEEILYFDDIPEYVAAARNAGWHAQRIDHEGDTCQQVHRHLIDAQVLVPESDQS